MSVEEQLKLQASVTSADWLMRLCHMLILFLFTSRGFLNQSPVLDVDQLKVFIFPWKRVFFLNRGLDVYLNYFGKKDETKYGVVSFELKIIN